MDQTSAASQTAASAPPQPADPPAEQLVAAPSPPSPPGFGARGRVRRRARFLRRARELAYRDLGGLVFSLHRFGQRNDSLVLSKLATLSRIDAELRALEASLSERQPVTVLREAGVTACPRCAAIHSGEDRFCPNCGLPMSRRSDLPIAGAPVPATPPATGAVAHASLIATPAPALAAQPGPAPTPMTAPPPHAPGAAPARAPTPPPTQTHATFDRPGPAGRSPTPPATAAGPPAQPSDDDQPTEIVRPRPSGS